MGESVITSIVTILTAIVGVAFIAVLVSRNSNTAGVIQSGGNAFAQALGAATAPVSASSGFSLGNGFGNFANLQTMSY